MKQIFLVINRKNKSPFENKIKKKYYLRFDRHSESLMWTIKASIKTNGNESIDFEQQVH